MIGKDFMIKKITTILILSFFTLVGFSQNDSIRGNQFELNGQLINEIKLTPHCGTIAWGTVIEFKIDEFSDSSYRLDSIGVIFTCPEFYKDNFFEIGKTYKITVADENQADFDWVVPNESILSKYDLKKKLWVIDAQKEK